MSRKIIKIGDSAGVTIPKRELEELGLGVGDSVDIKIKPTEKTLKKNKKILKEYEEFKKEYGEVLKNLADR